jgi:hypothetical protein
MGKPITTQKGAQYTQEFTAYENVNGVRTVSDITGATITFYVYDNWVNQRLIFSQACTNGVPSTGMFSFVMTTTMTKESGSFVYKIEAVYANGNVVPFGNGIFKIEDLA